MFSRGLLMAVAAKLFNCTPRSRGMKGIMFKARLLCPGLLMLVVIALTIPMSFFEYVPWMEGDMASRVMEPVLVCEEIIYKEIGEMSLGFDIYRSSEISASPHMAPVVVYVHGGAWMVGDKRSGLRLAWPMLEALCSKGFVFVSTDYRLANTYTKFPAPVEDVRDTVRYLKKNTDQLGIDSERIALMGVSAGGHLALMAALAPDDSLGGDPKLCTYSGRVRAVVSWCGPTDLRIEQHRTPIREILVAELVGQPFQNDSYLYSAASPAAYVSSTSPPILLLHSEEDSLVPYGQAQCMYEQAMVVGADVMLISIENSGHVYKKIDDREIQPELEDILKLIADYIERQLGLAFGPCEHR